MKTGPDRVIQYWKDKLYIINTLKDFQFTDKDLKDQGRMSECMGTGDRGHIWSSQ